MTARTAAPGNENYIPVTLSTAKLCWLFHTKRSFHQTRPKTAPRQYGLCSAKHADSGLPDTAAVYGSRPFSNSDGKGDFSFFASASFSCLSKPLHQPEFPWRIPQSPFSTGCKNDIAIQFPVIIIRCPSIAGNSDFNFPPIFIMNTAFFSLAMASSLCLGVAADTCPPAPVW